MKVTAFRSPSLAVLVVSLALVAGCHQLTYGVIDTTQGWGASWRTLVDGRGRAHMQSGDLRLRLEVAGTVYDPSQRAIYPPAVEMARTNDEQGLLISYWCRVFLDLDDDTQHSVGEPAWLWERKWDAGVPAWDPGPRALPLSDELLERFTLRTESVIELSDGAGFEWTDLDSRWVEWQIVDPTQRLIRVLRGN